MRNIILIILLSLIFHYCSFSQNTKSKSLVTVEAELIIDKYSNPLPCDSFRDWHQILIRVTNAQDTSISFRIMESSWPQSNFCVDNDSLGILHLTYDHNKPVVIKLDSGKSLVFNCLIVGQRYKITYPLEFRVGFCFYEWSFLVPRPPNNKINWFWSNKLRLKTITGWSYDIKE